MSVAIHLNKRLESVGEKWPALGQPGAGGQTLDILNVTPPPAAQALFFFLI